MTDGASVVDAKNEAVPVSSNDNMENTPTVEAPKPSPAQDLRNLQMLLVSGIFPGNVAPQVVAGYQLLERMAVEIEKNAAIEAGIRESK